MDCGPARRAIIAGVAALAALLAVGPARAQTPAIADIADYAGADRTERLVAGARQQGSLTLYSSAPLEDIVYGEIFSAQVR